MTFKSTPALLAGVLALGIAAPSAYAAEDPKGIWVDDKGRGAIEIKDCGGKLCGHVVWTRETADASRGCGKQIIGDAAPQGGSLWDGGWIYNPDKKKRYDVELKPLSDGTLRVKGYAGTKLFSRTMIWTKAPADLARCDAVTEAKAAPVTVKQDVAPSPAAAAAAPAALPPRTPSPAVSGSTALLKAPPAEANAPEAQSAPKAAAPGADGPAAKGAVRELIEEIASEDDPMESLTAKIDEIAPGKGYGITDDGDGNCRINVPFVKLTVKCKR